MAYREPDGYISRAKAQRTYKRSKSSFIRDVDDAFVRNDEAFLSHFRVLLNDGSEIEGPDATKEAVQAVQTKQPRWYIEIAFLDTRYWDTGTTLEEKGSQEGQPNPPDEIESADFAVPASSSTKLQHELEMAKQQIFAQKETIDRLQDDKTFLQNELEHRRGEIDKLRGFFESVGDAADSTAKLRQGSGDAHAVVESKPAVSVDQSKNKGSLIKRHLPTIHRVLSNIGTR